MEGKKKKKKEKCEGDFKNVGSHFTCARPGRCERTEKLDEPRIFSRSSTPCVESTFSRGGKWMTREINNFFPSNFVFLSHFFQSLCFSLFRHSTLKFIPFCISNAGFVSICIRIFAPSFRRWTRWIDTFLFLFCFFIAPSFYFLHSIKFQFYTRRGPNSSQSHTRSFRIPPRPKANRRILSHLSLVFWTLLQLLQSELKTHLVIRRKKLLTKQKSELSPLTPQVSFNR